MTRDDAACPPSGKAGKLRSLRLRERQRELSVPMPTREQGSEHGKKTGGVGLVEGLQRSDRWLTWLYLLFLAGLVGTIIVILFQDGKAWALPVALATAACLWGQILATTTSGLTRRQRGTVRLTLAAVILGHLMQVSRAQRRSASPEGGNRRNRLGWKMLRSWSLRASPFERPGAGLGSN
jgi:hypothetical protein